MCHPRHTAGVPDATVPRAPPTNDGPMGCATSTSGENGPTAPTGRAAHHRDGSGGRGVPISHIAWSFRRVMLFAAVVFVLSSETATAGRRRSGTSGPPRRPSPRRPPRRLLRRSLAASTAARCRGRRRHTSRSGSAQRRADGRIADRHRSQPDPQSARGDAPALRDQPTERQPTESQTIVPLVRPVVVLYGDSLAWEARNVFEQALADQPVEVVTRTFGGTAICDWHDEMTDDAATLRPGLVVIEFVGNNYTSCMQDHAGEPLTGAALVDRYAADAEAAIATFTSIEPRSCSPGLRSHGPATATLDLHSRAAQRRVRGVGSTSRRRPLRGCGRDGPRRRRVDRHAALPRVRAVPRRATPTRELRSPPYAPRTVCTSARRAPRRHAGSPATVRCGRAGRSVSGPRSAEPVLESLAATHRTPDSDA